MAPKAVSSPMPCVAAMVSRDFFAMRSLRLRLREIYPLLLVVLIVT
jgi:hypothetical protein